MKAKLSKIGAVALGVLAAPLAMAQTVTTPVELITAHSSNFISETTEVLLTGAGLVIAVLLVYKLVNLVLRFFQRG